MKILYTAFKGVNNTSFQMVNQLNGNVLFLTNSFQGLERDIAEVASDYDTVYMFGIDKNLKDKIRIETCAEYNGKIIFTDFNIASFEKKLMGKISYAISNKPTKYLCNAAYYHMLKKNPNSVFVRIPSLAGMNEKLMNALVELFD